MLSIDTLCLNQLFLAPEKIYINIYILKVNCVLDVLPGLPFIYNKSCLATTVETIYIESMRRAEKFPSKRVYRWLCSYKVYRILEQSNSYTSFHFPGSTQSTVKTSLVYFSSFCAKLTILPLRNLQLGSFRLVYVTSTYCTNPSFTSSVLISAGNSSKTTKGEAIPLLPRSSFFSYSYSIYLIIFVWSRPRLINTRW